MFALVDANNMYVSCERVFQPHLNGRPVVVLSSNDGACIARSNEAKELGVKMAQPWFQVKHLERRASLVALSANFELYSDMSSRMMAVMSRFAPQQEVYSIDESFLSFEGVQEDLVAIGQRLRAAILKETGLPASVGFGATKTLAKLANHIAKTADRKPGSYPAALARVCNLSSLSAAELHDVMKRTDVGDVWGVGRKIGAKLVTSGIRTVADLVNCNPTMLRRQFSVVLEKTLLELQGTSCLELQDVSSEPRANQQILVSRSFGQPIQHLDGIIEAVSEFTSRAAEKLRQQGSVAAAVNVFFGTSPFRQNDLQHQVNQTVPLVRPTADTALLVQAAVTAAKSRFKSGFRYAKAGAMLLDLSSASHQQSELDLFAIADEPSSAYNPEERRAGEVGPLPRRNRDALMKTLDTLNQRFGRDSVHLGTTNLASSGESVRVWATKQERRSPRCTTRWDEIPSAKC